MQASKSYRTQIAMTRKNFSMIHHRQTSKRPTEEQNLKALKQKQQMTYKGKQFELQQASQHTNLKANRTWSEALLTQKKNFNID